MNTKRQTAARADTSGRAADSVAVQLATATLVGLCRTDKALREAIWRLKGELSARQRQRAAERYRKRKGE